MEGLVLLKIFDKETQEYLNTYEEMLGIPALGPTTLIDAGGYIWHIPVKFDPAMGAHCIGQIGDGRYSLEITEGAKVEVINDLYETPENILKRQCKEEAVKHGRSDVWEKAWYEFRLYIRTMSPGAKINKDEFSGKWQNVLNSL